jgi:predicted dehydrogenase
MKIGIVGCGLMGYKRAKSLGTDQLVACADSMPARAEALARTIPGVRAVSDWRDLVQDADLDAVVVATSHDALAAISLAAVSAGKHVLVEKPAARRAAEIEPVIHAAQAHAVLVHVGFNHRYHRAFRQARELFESGALGELMFVRGRYGHGGRIGYDKEWRAQPELSGGGHLIDQGMHLIDLARWFLGDFVDVQGFAHDYYWDMLEDNAFLLLKTANRQVAHLQASCTEWKNLFSFEIFGRQGKLEISGLGGSYGVERLAFYRMLPQMGPPETTIWEYPMGDDSWDAEFAEFAEDIRRNRKPAAGLSDAAAALKIVETVYRESGL